MRVFGANDRIRLGLIGAGGRGNHLINMANQAGGIEWVAVCDAWDQQARQNRRTARRSGEEVRRLSRAARPQRYRRASSSPPGTTCTPASAVDACRAGKDVFVEKPMTSLPMQGVEVVEAVRETNRVVQVGMQQRNLAQLHRGQAEVLRHRHDRHRQHGAHRLERQQRISGEAAGRYGAASPTGSTGTPRSAGCRRFRGTRSAISTASHIGISPPAARPAACSSTWSTSCTGISG